MKKTGIVAVGTLLWLCACGTAAEKEANTRPAEQHLIHSYAVPAEAVVKHLDLDIAVNFLQRRIEGTADYTIDASDQAKRIVFDTKELEIRKVFVDSVETKNWWLGPEKNWLGKPLEVQITPAVKHVKIEYSTTEGAEALQWLTPQQTASKEYPFLFTQSEAVLARTWLPCQDSPGIRYTYNATVTVPPGLLALMSASNPTEVDSSGVYHFDMQQPIPSYLMALAVGKIAFAPIGDRTGVYAEPELIEAAAFEFADMQKMLESAERLYGKYAWEHYDVIVLPPSFPFGGMENPRLTFATPTILAGDKSLTSLVAHELAHSWSGNLVTNSTWNDFWLNEGFTVYFERRIMEDIYGKDYANMLAILGRQDLDRALDALKDQPEDTKLKLDLEGRNPDDGMSDIGYEKGYFMLRTIEESVGRSTFDTFLKKYFSENAFTSMSTEQFLARLKADLLQGSEERYDALEIEEWVYEPGLPDNCVEVSSTLFAQVDEQLQKWMTTGKVADIDTTGWTTHQWLHFLRHLPEDMDEQQLATLDKAFHFTTTGNSEIACEWYVISIEHGYEPANEEIEQFLVRVGRRKFLTPIYEALVEADPSMQRATLIYEKARPNYHSVSTHTLDALLNVSY